MADDPPSPPSPPKGAPPPQTPEQRATEDNQRRSRWPWIVAGGVTILFVAIVLLLIFRPHADVATNDAYVRAHYANIAPRVSGQIASVDVADNQPVRAGQLLATIDDRDLKAALAQAEAQLLADRAAADQAGVQVRRQPALIAEAGAQVEEADAKLILSSPDRQRYTALAETGAGSGQQREQADATWKADVATVRQKRANLSSTRDQLAALKAAHLAALAKVEADKAEVDRARLNLSYTRIHAPIEGTIAQRTVQVGNYVGPGTALMILVPLHDIYVEANYRELDLRHMRPGQRARIHVDAYDIPLDGVVESVAPISGAALSPIPPNNATGNFTKIVQRLPVKIRVLPHQPLSRLLRVGMSVTTTVDTGLADVVGEQRRTDARVTAPGLR